MTPKEIIVNHVANNGVQMTPGDLAYRVQKMTEQPHTQLVQEGNCLFLFSGKEKKVQLYIMNGGGPKDYVRSLTAFVKLMRKLEIKHVQMRIADPDSAQRIAKSSGIRHSTVTTVDPGDDNPYMIDMEV